MRVRDLIAELQKLDPDALVLNYDSRGECDTIYGVDLTRAKLADNGRVLDESSRGGEGYVPAVLLA